MFHVIEDKAMLRELTESILTDHGCDVLCFESGDQYLEYLKSPEFISPIAVLSDLTMPGINGYDLAIAIRKIHPYQKIILITGNADAYLHPEAVQQICYTLDKPYKPEKLISIVDSVTACHQLQLSSPSHAYPQKCNIDPLFDCQFASLNQDY
ncbi:MAG: response regulator [Mariprofundaceae bacterium]|nr:response regulator [Mariprofundaceae bacterium]